VSELPARPEVENQSECAGLISGARPIYQRRAAAASAFAREAARLATAKPWYCTAIC